MIKYFIKSYGRYIAMALAFATISFILNACEVKAENNYNQSITINYSETTTTVDRILYNDPNHTNKAFSNAGRGYLVGIISSYRYITNASFEIPTVYSINARTDSGYSTCEVSSLSNDTSDSTQMKANLYGFKCDLTMSTNGLISLSVNFKPQVNNAWTVESYRLTFNNNLQAQEVQYSQYLYDYMQNYVYPRLNGIENNTGATAQELQWIYSYLQNYIYIQQQTTNQNLNDLNDKLNQMMEQNQVCNYIDKTNIQIDNNFLRPSGLLENNNDWGVTNFYKITNKTKLTRKVVAGENQNARYCFYNTNKEIINCYSNLNEPIGDINIPNNSSYVRFSIQKSTNKPQFEICDTIQNITNQQNEQIIQGNKDINDSLNNGDTSSVSLDTITGQTTDVGAISGLITIPLTLLSSVITAFNGTCSAYNIGSLLGTNLIFPCIDLESILGSFLWDTIDIMITGIFIFYISKKFVNLFNKLINLENIRLGVVDFV